MPSASTAFPVREGDEDRLRRLGLSTETLHTALRPGLSRAANRTALALPNSSGTDIYHDTMEQLALMLADAGWKQIWVEQQPRLLHPEAILAFTLSSGINVANPDRRRSPRTRNKGIATRKSITAPQMQVLPIFDEMQAEQNIELISAASQAPLWFLLYERTDRGLNLEFSRPATIAATGAVVAWEQRILVGFLELDGDLSIFDGPGDEDFDVPVTPRH